MALIVLVGSLLVTYLFGRGPWWVGPAVVAASLVMVMVRMNGQTLYGWIRAGAVYRAARGNRSRERSMPPRLRDVTVASGTCGVAEHFSSFTAIIQLAPNLDLPTVVAEATTYTEDTITVAGVAEMLDQFGVNVDIDIVTTGRRVRKIGNYGLLYNQLIGGYPVVGDRVTWLLVRLDTERNLPVLSQRGSADDMAPKALASAANRIATRLRERGILAYALPAAEFDTAIGLLHEGVDPTRLRERWGRLDSPMPGISVTNFWVDLNRLGNEPLDDAWIEHPGRTTVTISLSNETRSTSPYSELTLLGGPTDAHQETRLRALVRYVGQTVPGPPLRWLRSLNGRQSDALLASLPGPVSSLALGEGVPLVAGSGPAMLQVPIGPSGQILGALSDHPRHSLAVSLCDHVPYRPQRRMIDANVNLHVAQQIVLRAAVVGADVEIHTHRPDRWQQLVSAVGDPESVRLADQMDANRPPSYSPTVAVFDGVTPFATRAQTTITVRDPGTPPRPSADLTINQVADSTVTVVLPMGEIPIDIVEPMGEARYLDTPPPAATTAVPGDPAPTIPATW